MTATEYVTFILAAAACLVCGISTFMALRASKCRCRGIYICATVLVYWGIVYTIIIVGMLPLDIYPLVARMGTPIMAIGVYLAAVNK